MIKNILPFIVLLLLGTPVHAAEDESNNAESAFSPKQGATELVVRTVEAATQSICVAAYSFTSEPIAQALLAAKARGVAVKVTLDKSQSRGTKSVLTKLQQNGLPVRINKRYAIMHDKFMVIDQKVLQLGSFNYTKAAETRNAENVLVIRRYKKVIASYAAECDRLWNEATEPLTLTDTFAGQAPQQPTENPSTSPQPVPELERKAKTKSKARAKAKLKAKPDIATPPIVSFP